MPRTRPKLHGRKPTAYLGASTFCGTKVEDEKHLTDDLNKVDCGACRASTWFKAVQAGITH